LNRSFDSIRISSIANPNANNETDVKEYSGNATQNDDLFNSVLEQVSGKRNKKRSSISQANYRYSLENLKSIIEDERKKGNKIVLKMEKCEREESSKAPFLQYNKSSLKNTNEDKALPVIYEKKRF